ERRGLAVSSAMLSATWLAADPSTVTLPLLESTLSAAMGFAAVPTISTSVLSLTQGVLRTMWLNNLKSISLAILIAGGVSGGVGVWAYQTSQSSRPPAQAGAPAPPQAQEKPLTVAPGSIITAEGTLLT